MTSDELARWSVLVRALRAEAAAMKGGDRFCAGIRAGMDSAELYARQALANSGLLWCQECSSFLPADEWILEGEDCHAVDEDGETYLCGPVSKVV